LTVVADASVVVAALISSESDAEWAATLMRREQLAPQLMLVEAANALRRRELAGVLPPEAAAAAHADLLSLPVSLYDYYDLADRMWELRRAVTMRDARYLALAEALEVPLATLDLRLARAPSTRCTFLTSPA